MHARANAAFIDDDLIQAKSLAEKAISCNPEIFEAYSLLSEIHLAERDIDRSVMAAFTGAHTRPSDTQNWARAAELIGQIASIVAEDEEKGDEQDETRSRGGQKRTARQQGGRKKHALKDKEDEEEEEEAEHSERGEGDRNEKEWEATLTAFGSDHSADQDHTHDEDEANRHDSGSTVEPSEDEANGDGIMEETAGEESNDEAPGMAAWHKIGNGNNGMKLPKVLNAAVYCYTRALGADPNNEELRLQRAALNKQRGRFKDSLRDYKRLNTLLPANLEILRNLAELYLVNNQSSSAVDCVRECMPLVQKMTPNESEAFGWKDIIIFAEVFIRSGQYAQGLSSVKKLSRWMLGRSNDVFWEDFVQDDREFDNNHEPRRIEVLHLAEQNHPLSSYGDGLPLELRIKLGVCRVQLEPGNLREAFVSSAHVLYSLFN